METKCYERRISRKGNTLLAINTIGDWRASDFVTGLVSPQRFTCLCVQRDEIAFIRASEYYSSSSPRTPAAGEPTSNSKFQRISPVMESMARIPPGVPTFGFIQSGKVLPCLHSNGSTIQAPTPSLHRSPEGRRIRLDLREVNHNPDCGFLVQPVEEPSSLLIQEIFKRDHTCAPSCKDWSGS